MPAADADRVRVTLESIEAALKPRPSPAKAVSWHEEDEPRVLVRDGKAVVGQRIHTPEGWAVIGSLGPAFLEESACGGMDAQTSSASPSAGPATNSKSRKLPDWGR